MENEEKTVVPGLAAKLKLIIKRKKKEKVKKNPVDETLDWLRSLVLTFIAMVLLFTFVVKTARVDGGSMNQTLEDGDFLFLRSFLYTPKQGDIITANSWGLNKRIVKRIIAVGGQTVDIDFSTGTVYVDGEALDEPYINNLTINDEGAFDYPLTVDEGYYFCLGDNRQRSKDSRHPDVGLISREDILGKAFLRVYPFDKITFIE